MISLPVGVTVAVYSGGAGGGRGGATVLVGEPYPPCQGKIDSSLTKLVFLTIKNCKQ